MTHDSPYTFTRFGDLLKHLRLRARLTQDEFGVAVGYSRAHVARLESGQRAPDAAAVKARFVEALHLRSDAELAARLIELATAARGETATGRQPGADPAPQAPNNLPLQLTSFVARADELSKLKRLLTTTRLLTLTGAGGCGKTRLAQQLAGGVAGQFTHGACFVGLASVQQAGDVVSAIARALDVPDRPSVSTLGVLTQYLSNKTMLLVLDNFEHLLDAAGVVTDLLLAAPNLKVLTTSREPLSVTGEQLFFVEPLDVGAAVELFAQRAQAAKPAFRLQGAEDVVTEICRRVDCLPLAIELAAATARRFSPRVLLAELDGSNLRGPSVHGANARDPAGLDVLATGPRDAPARHRTLRNAIEWSYGLLSSDEQCLFRALGVFAGGAEVAQIHPVMTAIGDTVATQSQISDLQSLLESLVDKNLVRAVEQSDGSTRYSLLELIREFALDKLVEQGELDAARRAHASAFCVLAEEAEPHIHDREQKYWVARLEREHYNFRAALSWSLSPVGDPQLGLRLASRMWLFWWVGHLIEGSQWLRKVLDAAGPQSPPFTLGRAYLGYGVLMTAMGLPEKVKAALEEAIRLLQSANDYEGVAFALYILGIYSPDDERLQELIQEGMAIDRWQGNRIGMEWAVYNYLHNLHEREAYQGYSEMIDSVIASASARGDVQLLSLALQDKCFSALFANDLPHARALAEQALDAARAIGESLVETMSLCWLGETLELLGDLEGAQRCMEEGLHLIEQYGWQDYLKWKVMPFSVLGKIARDRGDFTAARSYFLQSLDAMPPDDDWWGLEGLSCVAAAQGQHVRAARLLAAAEAGRHRRKDPWWEKDKRDLAPYIARSRAGLGDAAYEAAYAEGRNMSLPQAKAYAREE